MQKRFWESLNSFYLIGIGGVSMSGIAKLLTARGKTVVGSDKTHSEYTKSLESLGIKVAVGDVCESVASYDAVVYTDAVRPDNPQLIEAYSLGKTVYSRGQMLYEISRTFKKVIAVSGCHGKTTCTAMLAHILSAAKRNFCAHIGGMDKTFSNTYYCGNDYFLTEACEYNQNFLLLKPFAGVILNTDADHLECYGSKENLLSAYKQFANASEIRVSLYGDLETDGVTFGYDKNADYYAKKITANKGLYGFTVFERGTPLGTINLRVYGRHNILNALAAVAVARAVCVPFGYIKEGLQSFTGVERRFEYIGSVNGASVIADYAHHPNEIRASLKTAKSITSGKLFVVFQPHTYSRTKNFFKDFVKVLSPLNNLIIYRTFAAREYFDDGGSALTLSQSVKKSRYADNVSDLRDFVSCASEGDLILVLGAGDIYEIAKTVVKT